MKYQLKLEPSQISCEIVSGLSILDSSIQLNIYLEHGCHQGECGNCKAKLISGKVKSKTGAVIDTGDILTCISYPESDLILHATYFPELVDIKPVNLPCKVSNIQFINDEFAILTLRIPPHSKFKFLPGQYIDLSCQGVTRSYSIASLLSTDYSFDLHIRLFENGQFSHLLRNIQLNQVMQLSGPKGSFFIRQSKKPILLLASGTGFAPIHAMVENLIAQKDEREIYIYWRLKNSSSLYMVNPFKTKEFHNIKFIPYVITTDSKWCGRFGELYDILSADFNSLERFVVYACGSAGFIHKAKKSCFSLHLNESDFYTDLFTPT